MVANITATVKITPGKETLDFSQIGSLLVETTFQQRFQQAEQDILDRHGLSSRDFKALVERFEGHPHIKERKQLLIDMYHDAIRGQLLPRSPSLFPEPLRCTDTVLDLFQQIQTTKLNYFAKVLENYTTKEQVTQQLVEAAQKAEDHVLNHHHVAPTHLFRYTVNVYMKDDVFKKKKEAMEEEFSTKVIDLMKKTLHAREASEDPIHDAGPNPPEPFIPEVSQEKLEHLIRQHHPNQVVICLLLKATTDSDLITPLHDLSNAIQQFRRCHSPPTSLDNATFVFIPRNRLNDSFMADFPEIQQIEKNSTSSLYIVFSQGTSKLITSNPFQALDKMKDLGEIETSRPH